MELDGFEFYFDKMEFFKDGEPIELSKTEQKLLRVLLENKMGIRDSIGIYKLKRK